MKAKRAIGYLVLGAVFVAYVWLLADAAGVGFGAAAIGALAAVVGVYVVGTALQWVFDI